MEQDNSQASQCDQPTWLTGYVPQPNTGSSRWRKGMPSPNPKGRPPGITDKKAKLAQRMLADAEGIVAALIEKALEGDTGAASLILGRLLPMLKPQSEKVQFDFDPTASLPVQIEQVLAAIASGGVAPNIGSEIISALGTLADARAVTDLESRIITLEAREAR